VNCKSDKGTDFLQKMRFLPAFIGNKYKEKQTVLSLMTGNFQREKSLLSKVKKGLQTHPKLSLTSRAI